MASVSAAAADASRAPGMLLTLLALVGGAWYVIIWSICLLGLRVARSSFTGAPQRSALATARATSSTTDDEIPGVSVLRPLAGLDCNLYTNLCSSFEQQYDHERFEVILSVKSEADQALQVARDVVARYPHVRSKVIVGDENAGVNPKINNLVRPYAEAAFDIIWVVDSQVWLPSGALARAVDALCGSPPAPAPSFLGRRPHGSRVGLVHHVPLAVLPSSSWGSQVERVFLGTTHAKMYLAINALSIDSCVMGKSNMYRKSDLARVPDSFFAVGEGGSRGESGAIGSDAFTAADEAGGSGDPASTVRTSARPLARFGIYLAEDNMLALSLWRSPLSLAHAVVPSDVAHTAVGDVRTLRDYASRRMRWIRVRRHMVPAATYAEPLTESIPAGLLGLLAFRTLLLPYFIANSAESYAGTLLSALFLLAHFTAWHVVDVHVLRALAGGGDPLVPTERWAFRAAWCIREILALPIWAWALCGSTVFWRDRHYRILSDARAATIEPRPSSRLRGRAGYSALPTAAPDVERGAASQTRKSLLHD